MTQYAQNAPSPGDVFPLLKEESDIHKPEDEYSDPNKDDMIFHFVTASMTIPQTK